MRILHVVPTYYPAVRYGGPIRSVHGLAAAQAARGHDVRVFTTNIDGDGVSPVPTDRPVEMDGVNVHYFSVPFMRRLYWSPAMDQALSTIMDKIDVVHLHSVYLWPTYAAARAARRAGVPYLLAPRGMLVRRLINMKSRWIKQLWLALIERHTMRYSDGLHVTTEMEAGDIRELGLPVPRVYCVPNGVAAPSSILPFSRLRDGEIQRPYVLYLGRLNWKKGLDRLIAAWEWVPEPVRLVLAGNDEDGYRKSLEQLADKTGVRHRVSFIGEVADSEKWDLYRQAALFVLPSTSENFGNVVLEAMAMECPVMVSPGVGLADMVRQSGCGVVCTNEPEEMGRSIARICADADAAGLMGQRGRSIVQDSLSWSAVAASMEAAYSDMLQRRMSHPILI